MKKRIITGAFLLLFLLAMCIWADTEAFPVALAIVTLFGVYEMLNCTGIRKNLFVAIPLYVASLAVPFLMRHLRVTVFSHLPKILIALLLFVLYVLTIVVFSRGRYDITETLAGTVLCLYIIGAMACIMYVRDLKNGEFYWIFMFIGAWMTDVFAYFTGRLFGKHKLIPEISPKKTVEGAIGGVLGCVIANVILYAVYDNFIFENPVHNYFPIVVASVITSVVGMCGDLTASLIKRNYGIKDFGNLIPGHGGIMDRFDSIMFVSAAFYAVFNIFEVSI